MIVVVVKRGDVQMERGSQKAPITGLVAQQMFRREFSVADEANKGRWIRGDQAREPVFIVYTRGRAHGTRKAGPYGLPRGWNPQEPCARLNLKTGVDVVQQLRPDRDGELLPDDRDFILDESAVELIRAVIGREQDRGSDLDSGTRTESGAETPEKILLHGQRQVVKEIDVECIARFAETGLMP